MKNFMKTLGLTALVGAVPAVLAGPNPWANVMSTYADACYQQARLADQQQNAAGLSIRSCNRALNFQQLNREDRSVVLHNRGVIELTLGNDQAARTSFARSVRLTRKVDMRSLALAQLAHKQGDFRTAVEQYDKLLQAADPGMATYRDAIVRNRLLALDSLRPQSVTPVAQAAAYDR